MSNRLLPRRRIDFYRSLPAPSRSLRPLLLGAAGRQRRRALGRPAVLRSLLEGVGESDQFRFAERRPGGGHAIGGRLSVDAARERRRGGEGRRGYGRNRYQLGWHDDAGMSRTRRA